MRQLFRECANTIADEVGSPGAFGIGLLVVVIWAVTGPFYHYSDTWPLVINSTSSVVTFLMVFLIQSTPNRDAQTMQMKLNELIRVSTARNIMVDLENCSEERKSRKSERNSRTSERGFPQRRNRTRIKRTKPEFDSGPGSQRSLVRPALADFLRLNIMGTFAR